MTKNKLLSSCSNIVIIIICVIIFLTFIIPVFDQALKSNYPYTTETIYDKLKEAYGTSDVEKIIEDAEK